MDTLEKNNTMAIDLEGTSDELAISYVRAGYTKAYEVIMRRYNQRLYRITRSILQSDDAAQDAMQNAYITAYYKLDIYTPTGRFGAWLTRIAINEALMIKRKPDNRMPGTLEASNIETLFSTGSDPASVYANKELARLIETSLAKLPEDFRIVFVLRSIQQLSTQETAACLDIPEATVKTRLHRARQQMQEILGQHIDQAGMQVYEFAGQRCDTIVRAVLKKLDAL